MLGFNWIFGFCHWNFKLILWIKTININPPITDI